MLNADDPLIADLGRERARRPLLRRSRTRARRRPGGLAHASDSTRCRRCGAAYAYAHVYIGHLGDYACPGCGQRRPAPAVSAHDDRARRPARRELRAAHAAAARRACGSRLPGLYNVYNALAAAALATALGVAPETIAAGLGAPRAVFGRGERDRARRASSSRSC